MPKRRSDELAAIDEVMPLVDRFNELEHAQKMIFLDMVDPLLEEVVATKKPQKKAGKKSASKSPRASGMAAQLKERRGQREPMMLKDVDYNNAPCRFIYPDQTVCTEPRDSRLHDASAEYAGYHPFFGAPPAPAPSSANGGAGSTTRNSGTVMDSAGVVAHGASGGSS